MSDVVLMLGAGASRDAKLPDVKELVSTFLEREDVKHVELASSICARLSDGDRIVDIEQLLSTLDQLEQRDKQGLSAFTKPDGWEDEALRSPAIYSELRDDVYRHIREALHLERNAAPYYRHICDLAAIHEGIDVFSLNYDLALELACINSGTPYTDGFDPSWNPALFEEKDRFLIRLHKIHGSLLWHRLDDGSVEKVAVSPRRDPSVRHFSGSSLTEALVYPAAAGKDVHTDPYATLVERFRGALRRASVLVVIGYSFRDAHIKAVVTEALADHQPLRLIVVDPKPEEMLELSDELVPTRFSFRDLEARIHPLPLAATDALSRYEVRGIIPRAREMVAIEARVDEVRRERERDALLEQVDALVRRSLNYHWGYHLARCALGSKGDDYDLAREQYIAQRGESADTLIAIAALACSPDPDVREGARSALVEVMQLMCRGVVMKAAGGQPEMIYSSFANVIPDGGTARNFWGERIQVLTTVMGRLRTIRDYTEYHLRPLGELYPILTDSILEDLELALSFFKICSSAPVYEQDSEMLAVIHDESGRRLRGLAPSVAAEIMDAVERVWSGGRFPRALSRTV